MCDVRFGTLLMLMFMLMMMMLMMLMMLLVCVGNSLLLRGVNSSR